MNTLHNDWQSSGAYRTPIAFYLSGLPYRPVPIDLAKGEKRNTKNLAPTPQGRVPSLDIDGVPLPHSRAIPEYLDKAHDDNCPPPESARHTRALADDIAMETAPACNLSVRNYAAQNAQGGLTPDLGKSYFSNRIVAFMTVPNPPKSRRYRDDDTAISASPHRPIPPTYITAAPASAPITRP